MLLLLTYNYSAGGRARIPAKPSWHRRHVMLRARYLVLLFFFRYYKIYEAFFQAASIHRIMLLKSSEREWSCGEGIRLELGVVVGGGR